MDIHYTILQASEMLRIIQLNTLEDRSVSEKQHWDSAVKFLEDSVKEKLQVQSVVSEDNC
jgi:optic atrophy protein 1